MAENRIRSRIRNCGAATLLVGAGLVANAAMAPPAAGAIGCTTAELIAAINAANANSDPTTIDLTPDCVYSFTTAPPTVTARFWYGPSALPAIASPITINGNGATIERISSAPFRLFFVGADPANDVTFDYASPGAGNLTLRNLTLKGGLAKGGNGASEFSGGGGGAGMGGAIFSQGRVTLDGVTITNSTAQGGNGGAANATDPDATGGGGGIGADASGGNGGGFGGGNGFGGGSGNSPSFGGGGGGGGFRPTDDGIDPPGDAEGQGGGPNTGTGGAGGFHFDNFGAAGNGSGGGGDGRGGDNGGPGGSFGFGGGGATGNGGGGGGGGVGGGGGGSTRGAGGGGGFGGGGGGAFDDGDDPGGGNGGFGGGGGGGESLTGGTGGDNQGPGGTGQGGYGAGRGGVSPDTDGSTGGAGGGGGAGMGGAVFNHQGQLTITNSTLSGNTATGGAGGAAGGGAGAVAGVNGLGLGGAIFNLNGVVSLDSATVAFNTAGSGGALFNLAYLGQDGAHTYAAQVTLVNSILSNSNAGAFDMVADQPFTVSGELANTVVSSIAAPGPNIVMSSSVINGAGPITGVAPISTDPNLAPLAFNQAGLTPTHALTATSSAFNTGATTLSMDQTGVSRPQGAADDIGAFELQQVVAPQADVSVTKTDNPDPVTAGQDISYTITVTNSVTGSTASSVALNDPIPANTTFVSRVVPGGWNCPAQVAGTADPLSCTLASLAPAAPQIFTLVVKVNAGASGPITNTATVSAAGDALASGNNVATATTTVIQPTLADVTVTLLDSPDPVAAGQNITYTITVNNSAAGSTATNLQLTDPIPANTTFVSRVVPGDWNCANQVAGTADPLSCTKVSLAPAAPQAFTLVVKVNAGASGSVGNTAAVVANVDSTPANNVATVLTTVNSAPVNVATKPAIVRGSTTRLLRNALTTGGADLTFSYGATPLAPLSGDWDGNGTMTPGTFEGGTFKLRNTNNAGGPDDTFIFGDPRGFPVAGDFNGDGVDDVAVYRGGLWEVRLSTGATSSFTFGSGAWPATVPVAGDWDGDGTAGVGLFVSGTWTLRTVASSSGVNSTVTFGPGANPYPVVGDWDGDGDDTVGVKSATGATWQLTNTTSAAPPVTIIFDFGQGGTDLPVAWR